MAAKREALLRAQGASQNGLSRRDTLARAVSVGNMCRPWTLYSVVNPTTSRDPPAVGKWAGRQGAGAFASAPGSLTRSFTVGAR